MGQRGNALLETAIVLPLCLLFVGVLFELGAAYNGSLFSRYLSFMGARMSSLGAAPAEVRREVVLCGEVLADINNSHPLTYCSVKNGGKDTKVTFESIRFSRFPAVASLFPLVRAKASFQLPVEDRNVFSR